MTTSSLNLCSFIVGDLVITNAKLIHIISVHVLPGVIRLLTWCFGFSPQRVLQSKVFLLLSFFSESKLVNKRRLQCLALIYKRFGSVWLILMYLSVGESGGISTTIHFRFGEKLLNIALGYLPLARQEIMTPAMQGARCLKRFGLTNAAFEKLLSPLSQYSPVNLRPQRHRKPLLVKPAWQVPLFKQGLQLQGFWLRKKSVHRKRNL